MSLEAKDDETLFEAAMATARQELNLSVRLRHRGLVASRQSCSLSRPASWRSHRPLFPENLFKSQGI